MIDAVTFFISALCISRIAYTPSLSVDASEKTIRAALHQYVDGLSYLRQHRDIFFVTLNKSANSLFVGGAFQVFQVTIAESIFVIGDGGGISLGMMYAAMGIGTGFGPIVMRRYVGDRDCSMRLALILGYLMSASGCCWFRRWRAFRSCCWGRCLRASAGGIVWVFSTQLCCSSRRTGARARFLDRIRHVHADERRSQPVLPGGCWIPESGWAYSCVAGSADLDPGAAVGIMGVLRQGAHDRARQRARGQMK